jgi:hypothetical protein
MKIFQAKGNWNSAKGKLKKKKFAEPADDDLRYEDHKTDELIGRMACSAHPPATSAWGEHPIAAVSPRTQSDRMTVISRYPLGPCQQALLGAMLCPLQPPLVKTTSGFPQPVVENDADSDYLTAD